jgi:hypothetical protein
MPAPSRASLHPHSAAAELANATISVAPSVLAPLGDETCSGRRLGAPPARRPPRRRFGSAPAEELEVEANSATELAGLAVNLTQGDPFLEAARSVRSGPLRAYRKGREAGLLRKDARQEATVLALHRLHQDLEHAFPPLTRRPTSGLTILDAAPPDEAAAERPWWKKVFSRGDAGEGEEGGPGDSTCLAAWGWGRRC